MREKIQKGIIDDIWGPTYFRNSFALTDERRHLLWMEGKINAEKNL